MLEARPLGLFGALQRLQSLETWEIDPKLNERELAILREEAIFNQASIHLRAAVAKSGPDLAGIRTALQLYRALAKQTGNDPIKQAALCGQVVALGQIPRLCWNDLDPAEAEMWISESAQFIAVSKVLPETYTQGRDCAILEQIRREARSAFGLAYMRFVGAFVAPGRTLFNGAKAFPEGQKMTLLDCMSCLVERSAELSTSRKCWLRSGMVSSSPAASRKPKFTLAAPSS